MTAVGIFLAAVAAGTVQAVTGFGAGIILMMVVPRFFDMLHAPALSSAITIGISAALAWRFRQQIDITRQILPIVLYLTTSTAAITVAGALNLNALAVAFGVFLMLLSLYFLLLAQKFALRDTVVNMALCALVSGVFSGLFGVGGPLMAVYFLAASETKERYVGSLQFFFAVTSGFNLGVRIFHGIYTLALVPLTILGMLGINAGKLLGLKLLDRMNIELMKKLVYGYVGLSGVITILNHF